MSTSHTSTSAPLAGDPAADLPRTLCYLNGEYTALQDAKISVLDRGFIFGDGVYEVLPVYAGKPFRFAQHMARLDRSLGELRMPNPLTHAAWQAGADVVVMGTAVEQNPEILFEIQKLNAL